MELDLLLRLETKSSIADKLKKKLDEDRRKFEEYYQRWYTESHAIIRQLIPDRLVEFEQLYKGDGKRRSINTATYNIQDWLNGVRAAASAHSTEKAFDDFAITLMRFKTQAAILGAVASRFESSLFDIRQIVQADLFDSELDAARELAKHGFLRGAGAVAGVIIEKHLD